MSGVLLGFINMLINIVIIVLIAFVIVWLLERIGFPPSADMMKWGRILVILLCVAAVVAWLVTLGGAPYYGPHFLR